MPIARGINHIATLSADLDATVAFYQAAFEAEITFTMDADGDHPRMTIVDIGGSELNIFEVPADSIVGDRRRIGGRGPIDHFGIEVESLAMLEAMRERLVAAGAEIGEIQQLGSTHSLFFRDPDGMELEVTVRDGSDQAEGMRPAAM